MKSMLGRRYRLRNLPFFVIALAPFLSVLFAIFYEKYREIVYRYFFFTVIVATYLDNYSVLLPFFPDLLFLFPDLVFPLMRYVVPLILAIIFILATSSLNFCTNCKTKIDLKKCPQCGSETLKILRESKDVLVLKNGTNTIYLRKGELPEKAENVSHVVGESKKLLDELTPLRKKTK
ncbi:MAG: zinc ribbon domain-containing protein [Archaeoglobaceae archaeon]